MPAVRAAKKACPDTPFVIYFVYENQEKYKYLVRNNILLLAISFGNPIPLVCFVFLDPFETSTRAFATCSRIWLRVATAYWTKKKQVPLEYPEAKQTLSIFR